MQREDPRMRFHGYAPYMAHKEKVGISSGPIQRRDSFIWYLERYLSDPFFFPSSNYDKLSCGLNTVSDDEEFSGSPHNYVALNIM
ncbi:uncharacterized protein CDAR_168071 [Caerostris darwini]|uniref:Uncharacterized protein n=1 Tax=Caerostris darwini TaxID=1538125 RepID=A0AAV4VJR6_9ARAC|nr:uncharacterized protein CDAR_168071 [Caerostris darwini]